MKIVLIGSYIRRNFGGPSILLSIVKVLRNTFIDAKLVYLSLSPDDTSVNPRDYGLDQIVILPNPKLILIYFAFLLKELVNANILIDIWGILFSDSLERSLIYRIFEGLHLILGKILKKCVIKYTADIGPFYSIWTRLFARICLNNLDLIFVRSRESRRYLENIGIKTPIVVAPDAAFILDQKYVNRDVIIPPEKLSERKIIVGVSVSHTITKFSKSEEDYIRIISKIIEYLVKKYNALVILIPNELFSYKKDDLYIARKIYNMVISKENVIILNKEYDATELKGIIGLCNLLIGSRYHSIIAALSQGIPTLAIGWHHKYNAVMELVGLENFVCDIKKLDLNDICNKIDYLLKNNFNIKLKILNKLKCIRRKVFYTGFIISKIAYSKIFKIKTTSNSRSYSHIAFLRQNYKV